MASGLSNSLDTFSFAGGMPPEPVMRFTVEQYHDLVRTGILLDDAPVELLEGWIITKMVKSAEHSYTTRILRRILEQIARPETSVHCEAAITLSESEPEPDIAIARGNDQEYCHRKPTPSDILLVVEVADSSVARDRGIKKRIYARSAVPVYWIVNVEKRLIEVYTDPTGPAAKPDYRQRRDYTEHELVPVVIEGKELSSLDPKAFLPI